MRSSCGRKVITVLHDFLNGMVLVAHDGIGTRFLSVHFTMWKRQEKCRTRLICTALGSFRSRRYRTNGLFNVAKIHIYLKIKDKYGEKMRFVLLVLPTEGGRAAEPGYVHSGHDFRRERLRVGEWSEGISVKLIQASLTLTAPNYVLLGHDFCRDST